MALLLLAVFAILFELTVNRPLHWDEFLHLSETYAMRDGSLGAVLQVMYARLFIWLPSLPVDVITQVRVARALLLILCAFTVVAIYSVARLFADRPSSLLASIMYASSGFFVLHSYTYRADPIAAALLMASLWVLARSRLRGTTLVIVVVLLLLSVGTTIKSVFYLPAVVGVLLMRRSEINALRSVNLCIAAGVSVLTAVGLTLAFKLLQSNGAWGAVATYVANAGAFVFGQGLFPQPRVMLQGALLAPLLALLVIVTPVVLVGKTDLPHRWALLLMFVPVLSLAIYQNSYAYFYPFILAPAMIPIAAILDRLLRSLSDFSAILLAASFLVMAVSVSVLAVDRETQNRQRQTLNAIHEIFPDPVPYFDSSAMVPGFPKANFFMSTWGLNEYQRGRTVTFHDAMDASPVPLLITDREPLVENQWNDHPSGRLLARDAELLRDSYIWHWGPVWVAGHSFPGSSSMVLFDVRVPGVYTLEGAASTINGRYVYPGQTVALERGSSVFIRRGEGTVTLRWGPELTRPAESFREGPLFHEF